MNIQIIRRTMRQKKIGNKELAQRSGIPLSTLNNILRGETLNPTVTTMQAITKVLGLTLDDISNNRTEGGNGYTEMIYREPRYRILLDSSASLSEEDLEMLIQMAKRLEGKE